MWFFGWDDRPISGASMNPARSLGPAIVSNQYRGIWIYILGPIVGAISGAWVYNIIRFTDKPLREITKSSSFLRYASSRNGSKRWSSQPLLCICTWCTCVQVFGSCCTTIYAWNTFWKENVIMKILMSGLHICFECIFDSLTKLYFSTSL